MIFTGRTEGGKLKITNRVAFESRLKELDGKEIAIKLEHRKDKIRSLQANDRHYGILRKIMKVLIDRGYDDMNVVKLNNYFKKMFLQDIIPDILTGEPMEIVKNTSELSSKELKEHDDRIVRFALQDMEIEPEWLEPYISD